LPQQSFYTALTTADYTFAKDANLSDPLDREIVDRLMQEFDNPELLFKPRLPGRRRLSERKLSQAGEQPLAFNLPMKPVIPPVWKSALPMHLIMRKLKTLESGIRS
jgi:hypothetical protein